MHDWPEADVYEWSPVYDPSNTFEREGGLENPMVGLTGWAIPQIDPKNPNDTSSLSQGDVWFTHPWWYDWEYYIAPDPAYEGLLAPDGANTGIVDDNKEPDYVNPTTIAQNAEASRDARRTWRRDRPGLVPGAVPAERTTGDADRDLRPLDRRHRTSGLPRRDPSAASDRDRERRPAACRRYGGASPVTHVELMSRPYFPSQKFSEGNFIDHLAAEVLKVDTAICGIPLSTQVEAHPSIYDLPYAGRPFIELFVKPPVPRSKEVYLQQTLMVNFKFNVRSGVAVAVYDAGYRHGRDHHRARHDDPGTQAGTAQLHRQLGRARRSRVRDRDRPVGDPRQHLHRARPGRSLHPQPRHPDRPLRRPLGGQLRRPS